MEPVSATVEVADSGVMTDTLTMVEIWPSAVTILVMESVVKGDTVAVEPELAGS